MDFNSIEFNPIQFNDSAESFLYLFLDFCFLQREVYVIKHFLFMLGAPLK